MSFLEYQVEMDGALHSYDTWSETKTAILAATKVRVRPFSITCVKYLSSGGHRTLWTVAWTKPELRATREERKRLRQAGAEPALDLLKWSPT
jgi:hypothetical protein